MIDVLGILFTAAMTLVMLFTYRVPRRIAVLPLLLSTVLSLIALPVFVWLSGARLNLWLACRPSYWAWASAPSAV